MSRRLAYFVISVVFANYLLDSFLDVVKVSATPARIVGSLACLLTIGYLQLRVFSRPGAHLRSGRAYLALGAMAVLVYVPLLFFPAEWTNMPGFLAGSSLLVLPGRVRWLVFFAVALGNGGIQAWYVDEVFSQVYYMIASMVAGLVVYGLSRLPSLVKQLETVRSELAELAVSQERLRFARDLHDLLGFSLSAITLKVELARKLIGAHTDRALRELAEILGIAREALADVRAVASSYRELSLADEIESARSVLTAAGVATTIETDHPDLSPRSRTVLATVLREGVTNLLRHSEATRCAITISGAGRAVSIDIVNDGAPAEAEAERGSGLTNLATRTAAIGGSLLAQTSPDRTYRLHAEVPVEPALREPASDPRPAGQPMAMRFAQVLFTAVVVGYGLMSLSQVAFDYPRIGLPGMAVAVLATAVELGLVLSLVGRPHVRLNLVSSLAVLAVMAMCVYVPVWIFGNPLMGVAGFVAGSAALLLPRRVGWWAFLAIVAGQMAMWIVSSPDFFWVAYGFVAVTNHGLVLYALTRLRSMVSELHEAREELATAAVAQERLRFARDLHDLLGYSLSAITLKSELTHRLATADPDRARQELTEVLEISRQALADVRSVALSYRELSFDEETQSAQALLSAADIEVTVRIDACDQLPKEVKVTLATVLREGVTNLLRHSKAEHCEIVLSSSRHLVTMDIINDGIPVIERKSRDGSGIGNLTTRVRALGGDLHAGLTPEHTYRLRAEIPLSFN
ncbi:Signal transduction histidine kinase [Lentzea albidocapillata subsp. violacea]|uniref:Signal transduction histidine kinase n=1 Tax=Lentzea albidocapillata subsp. violacea TaxID=128104 RepID=A0A1G9B996_9PSEU|nr:histidine kinase [Lentzea albidocapillata]SDK36043.1 Signal transduction histidine kinase [Lentzea albidocapillata subsp. violacea]